MKFNLLKGEREMQIKQKLALGMCGVLAMGVVSAMTPNKVEVNHQGVNKTTLLSPALMGQLEQSSSSVAKQLSAEKQGLYKKAMKAFLTNTPEGNAFLKALKLNNPRVYHIASVSMLVSLNDLSAHRLEKIYRLSKKVQALNLENAEILRTRMSVFQKDLNNEQEGASMK